MPTDTRYGPRRDPGFSFEGGGCVHNCECGAVTFYRDHPAATRGRRAHLKTCPVAIAAAAEEVGVA